MSDESNSVIKIGARIGEDIAKLPFAERAEVITTSLLSALEAFMMDLGERERREMPPFYIGVEVQLIQANSVQGQNLIADLQKESSEE